MASSGSNMGDVPPLDQFFYSLDDSFQDLPENMKYELLAAKVRNDVAIGNDDYLATSPRAKRLKTNSELSHSHLSKVDRNSFVESAVKVFFNEKMPENQVTKISFTETISTQPTKHDIQPPTNQGPLEVVHLDNSLSRSLDLKPPPFYKQNPNYDLLESHHSTITTAMDYLGPAVVVVKRTYKQTSDSTYEQTSNSTFKIPLEWYCSMSSNVDATPSPPWLSSTLFIFQRLTLGTGCYTNNESLSTF
jgi:hypothetical protein